MTETRKNPWASYVNHYRKQQKPELSYRVALEQLSKKKENKQQVQTDFEAYKTQINWTPKKKTNAVTQKGI